MHSKRGLDLWQGRTLYFVKTSLIIASPGALLGLNITVYLQPEAEVEKSFSNIEISIFTTLSSCLPGMSNLKLLLKDKNMSLIRPLMGERSSLIPMDIHSSPSLQMMR